ncbi:hypothetical protein GCM10010293_16250 [Streptomyces griseoflavus]|uniref:hypothetical protein n=1 Tax=Streptomyces griseoflavus TaxID=35619 RepID=UPI00167D4281|nr:hypothetical protein [Streptomyces griseoflavus]GGV20456.1 hypothetical protein GCM10010293_16250 [Streptomyces griseoflavus]
MHPENPSHAAPQGAGRSALGLLLSLRGDPTARHRDAVRVAEERRDGTYPQIDGVGTLLYSRERLLSGRERIAAAVALGHEPAGDAAALAWYVDDLGPWLAGEYARVHGVKAPRPD